MGDGAEERGVARESCGTDCGVAAFGAGGRTGDTANSSGGLPAGATRGEGVESDDGSAAPPAFAGHLSLPRRGGAGEEGGAGGRGCGTGGKEKRQLEPGCW